MSLDEPLRKLADETARMRETMEQIHANLRTLPPFREDFTLDEQHALSDAHIRAVLDAFDPLEKAIEGMRTAPMQRSNRMVSQPTRNALNDITDQMERLREAILEANDQETVGALDDLTEAINDLKLALGQGIDSASLPPETA